MLEPLLLGLRLRRARQRRALSQRALSKQIGCDQAHTSCIERGEKVPSLALLCHLARTLHVSPCALLQGMWEDTLAPEEVRHEP